MAFLYWLAVLPLRMVYSIVGILRGLLRLMFSIAKFIVLIAVIGLVFGLFWLARLGQGLSRPRPSRHSKTDQHDTHNANKAVDLHQCPQCKAWVAGACESCAAK